MTLLLAARFPNDQTRTKSGHITEIYQMPSAALPSLPMPALHASLSVQTSMNETGEIWRVRQHAGIAVIQHSLLYPW